MSVIRVHKNANYTVMSNYHFKEREMSLKAKGLLSLMLSLPDDWNYSISGLVTLSKDGKDSVMAALSELEKFGYLLRIKKQNSKGQFSGVEYNIYEEPQRDFPDAAKQKAAKQKEVKQHAENQQLLNTNKLNNNNINNTNELSTDKEQAAVNLSIYKEILSHIKDIELKALLLDYIQMRIDIDAPISQRGLSMLINRLARLSNFDNKIQKEMLENAILNNWKSVYLPKEEIEEGGTQYQKDELYYKMREYYEKG
jgi:hypothetical protein